MVERGPVMAGWQAVGFMHGVMNTDNFSIVGLTLDYGPYGFMEAFEPQHICNHTDQGGRYAFDRQPSVGLWNCHALANALAQLVEPARLEALLGTYVGAFHAAYGERMRAKLGLALPDDGDEELIAELLALMTAARSDFTRTFRLLAGGEPQAIFLALGGTAEAAAWVDRYDARARQDLRPPAERAAAMNAVNPRIVLRNHLAQEAIEASEAGDDEPARRLLAALEQPFSDDPAVASYDRPAPADRPAVEVSCSS